MKKKKKNEEKAIVNVSTEKWAEISLENKQICRNEPT